METRTEYLKQEHPVGIQKGVSSDTRSVRMQEFVRVVMHLNGGYTKVRLERFEGSGMADGGIEWDIPTQVIPSHLRFIGTRFLLLADLNNPDPNFEVQELAL